MNRRKTIAVLKTAGVMGGVIALIVKLCLMDGFIAAVFLSLFVLYGVGFLLWYMAVDLYEKFLE